MKIRHLTLVAVMALLTLASPAAASPGRIYEDCQDGRLDGTYSAKDLRAALNDMPTDIDEYTNCREIIRSAQQGVRGPGGTGPAGAGDAPGVLEYGQGGLPLGPDKGPIDPRVFAQPEERKAIEEARAGIGLPERTASGGAAGRRPGDATSADLPPAVIVLLVLAGGGLLFACAPALRSLVLRRLH